MGQVLSKVLSSLGDESWSSMPWRHFNSTTAQARKMPTFLVIEWTYHVAAWACLAHAARTGNVPMWLSSWICGTANDAFMMFLPFVDNFWQAQATVMLTPRMPLYIVEVYATIIYLSSTAARQFNLPILSEGALTGLLAHVLYGVYDINGPTYLWWTWHDADLAISKRLAKAPYGSSLWILTYVASHQLLTRFCEFPSTSASLASWLVTLLEKTKRVVPTALAPWLEQAKRGKLVNFVARLQLLLKKAPWAIRIAFSGAVCTPMFMALMGVFQIFSFDKIGVPGKRTYVLTIATYLALTLQGFKKAHASGALYAPKGVAQVSANAKLLALVSAFYAANAAIAFKGDPTKHVSTGCHQIFNEKSRKVKDIMGYLREDFLRGNGPERFSRHDYRLPSHGEHGELDTAGEALIRPKPTYGSACEWYSVIGKKQNDRGAEQRTLLYMTGCGLVGFSLAFTNVFSRKVGSK